MYEEEKLLNIIHNPHYIITNSEK